MNDAPTTSPAAAHEQTPWHSLTVAESFERLGSRPEGLTREEAERRLAEHGPNELSRPERRGPVLRFVAQFHNVLIYVLLVAAAGTALLGEWVDTGVILGVVVINAVIGFVQEGKAEQALESIRKMLSLTATVVRDGERTEVPAEELVPGDVVFLESGDRVPADLRLTRMKNLRAQEAALTGESVAVEKGEAPVPADAPVGDRACMAYSGTLIASGRGSGVVVATGNATEIGRIGAMVSEVEKLTTPLLRQMAAFGRKLTVAILALAAITCGIAFLRGYAVNETFLLAVGIAVAAIPEGLPAVITITLAIGVQNMARRNAIIRRLPAVETLGSVSVVCTDKTGTLTRNEMTVQTVATSEGWIGVTGVGYAPEGELHRDGQSLAADDLPILAEIARVALLCNEADLRQENGEWRIAGDPTEGALIVFACKAGLDAGSVHAAHPRVDIIPFESERRYMATLHRDGADGIVYVKGAPERVLEMCRLECGPDGDRPLDPARWGERADELASQGQRVLAAACKRVPADQDELRDGDVEGDLTLLGLFGLIDPPREEALAAIRNCQSAGIRVKMITGDHAATARAIAAQLGLKNDRDVITGPELDRLDDEELRRAAPEVDVFARTAPEHKLRLVEGLQAHGLVVAMTGDGVNDAPALKRADVGVAMGQEGTEAAKEAAEMVLADDNFATIANAVEEGRTVYDNLKKVIAWTLPTNGAEASVLVAAVLLGYELPITPLQILWVNMTTAVTLGLALAFEPAESDVLRRPPRASGEPILSRFLVWRIAYVSLILVAGTFGMFVWERETGADLARAQTVAVNTLVMFEVFYLLNTRHMTAPGYTAEALFGSVYVLGAIAIALVLQLLFTYAPPFQFLFGTETLSPADWAVLTAVAFSVFILVEIEKASRRARER